MGTVATPQRVRSLPTAILAVGLLVFAALSIASRVLFDQTEDRLLQQQTNEALAVLESGVTQTRARSMQRRARGTSCTPSRS